MDESYDCPHYFRTAPLMLIESIVSNARVPLPLDREELGLARAVLAVLMTAFFAAPVCAQQKAERGYPWFENYSADTYGSWRGDVKVARNQNWSVTQGPRGIIYVANQEGLLSYDGSRWSALRIGKSDEIDGRGNRRIFSVACLPEKHPDAGRILVGAEGTFGVLRADSLGRLTYASLLPHLSSDVREKVGEVQKVSATSKAAYFLTPRRLFRWQGDSLSTWTPADFAALSGTTARSSRLQEEEHRFLSNFVVRDTFYVQVRGVGLLRAGSDGLRPVPVGERFAESRIYALMPRGHTALLIGTRAEGFFLRDDTAGTRALDWPVEPWLQKNQLSHGARLPDGTYALATRRGGLLHVNVDGQRLHVLDTRIGLETDKVNHVFVDRAGSLWLALNDGVTRVDASAPFTYYGESLGLEAGVESIERHENVLYAGTQNGLHRLLGATSAFARFERVPGVTGTCNDLASTPHGLLVATSDGVAVHRQGQGTYTVESEASSNAQVVLPGASGIAYVGYADGGVQRLREQRGRWEIDPTFPGDALDLQRFNARNLAQAEDGTLWAAGPDGVARIANPATHTPTVRRYGVDDGLPVLPGLKVFEIKGRVYFSTRKGLRRFERKHAGLGRFVPDSTFGARWAQPDTYVTDLIEADDGSVWGRAVAAGQNGRHVLTSMRVSAGRKERESRPLVPFRDIITGQVYVEDEVVWLGSRGLSPLSRLDFSNIWRPPSNSNPAAKASGLQSQAAPQIQHVTVGVRDSLVYGGPSATKPLEFASAWNGLHVEYALPRFVLVATPVEYRTRLGDEVDWSGWTRKATANYAGLASGRYRFQVQARLPGGSPTSVATLPFHILAPWYRTPWALGLWVLLGLSLAAGLGAAGVRWRTRHLKRRQHKLEATVAERTGALREEKRQTEKQAERLREMDQLKSRFFANVSHEFRTPLTLTIGPLEDLQADEAASLSADVRRKVDLALRNSRRLLRRTGQLLDITKMEAGELHLNARRADLTAFVRRTMRSFVPLAERRRVRFGFAVPHPPVPVCFDEEKLEQVLANLLSNAFKFTPKGGAVHVAISCSDDACSDDACSDDATNTEHSAFIAVRDNGPGIPNEKVPHLFERFYQAEETSSDVQPGTGIGLSLAKDLIELHGGTIAVETEVGFGTIFTVRLPMETTPSGGAASARTPAATTLLANGNATSHADPPGAPSSKETANEDPDRTTLLIADDNAEIRRYVRDHFEPRYRILEVADGRAALQTARSALPDLVVSDVMMPHLDGFEFVRALRADRETDFIPVVLLTARATGEDKLEGLSEGADAYLTKPFNVRELRARVENLIASRQRLKEHFSPSSDASPFSSEPSRLEQEDLSPSQKAYLERARKVVKMHLSDENFGVEQLAEALEQSRTTLYRRLRALLERTPTAFIRAIRLEQAARLLREERGTVSEVAYAVGFKSVSHFSQAFRDTYDVTPSVYLDETPRPESMT